MSEIQRGNQTQKQVAEISPEYAEQKSGSVGLTKETITFATVTRDILIRNTHASQKLYLYLQSAEGTYNTSKLSLGASEAVAIPLRTTGIQLQGNGAATTYEVLASKE